MGQQCVLMFGICFLWHSVTYVKVVSDNESREDGEMKSLASKFLRIWGLKEGIWKVTLLPT